MSDDPCPKCSVLREKFGKYWCWAVFKNNKLKTVLRTKKEALSWVRKNCE